MPPTASSTGVHQAILFPPVAPGVRNKGFKVKGPKELMERYEEVFRAGLDALVQTVIDS